MPIYRAWQLSTKSVVLLFDALATYVLEFELFNGFDRNARLTTWARRENRRYDQLRFD